MHQHEGDLVQVAPLFPPGSLCGGITPVSELITVQRVVDWFKGQKMTEQMSFLHILHIASLQLLIKKPKRLL